jgi:type II secretory pathway pseudopilin PulG
MYTRSQERSHGYTLIETLIAATVGLIILGLIVTTSVTYLRTSREEGAKNAVNEQIAGIIDLLNEDLGAAGTGSGRVGGGAGIMGLGPEGERRAVHIGSPNGDLDIWRCAAGRAGTVAAVRVSGSQATVVVTGIAAEEYGGGVGTGCLFFPAAPKGPGLLVLTAPPRPPVAGDFSAAGEFSDINAAAAVTLVGRVNAEACLELAGVQDIGVGDFVAPLDRLIQYRNTPAGWRRTEFSARVSGCASVSGKETLLPKILLPEIAARYFLADGSAVPGLDEASASLARGVQVTMRVADPTGTRSRRVSIPIFVQSWAP